MNAFLQVLNSFLQVLNSFLQVLYVYLQVLNAFNQVLNAFNQVLNAFNQVLNAFNQVLNALSQVLKGFYGFWQVSGQIRLFFARWQNDAEYNEMISEAVWRRFVGNRADMFGSLTMFVVMYWFQPRRDDMIIESKQQGEQIPKG